MANSMHIEKNVPVVYFDKEGDFGFLKFFFAQNTFLCSFKFKEFDFLGESNYSYFDAFRNLRKTLEKSSIYLKCLGCCEYVHPSPMQESMGGFCAYTLCLGQSAKLENVVDWTEVSETVKPVTVDRQESFFTKWKQSLLSHESN